METFTWKTKFGDYKNCSFLPRHYRMPRNKELEVYNNDGPIAILSVNTEEVLEPDEIMIKNYSEGEGNDKRLIEMGIIHDDPVKYVRSGFVVIPIYKLTERGIKLWE